MLVAIRPPRPFGNTSASKIRARWRTACKSLTVSPSSSEEASSSTSCNFLLDRLGIDCRFERLLEIALQIVDRQLQLEAVQLLGKLCLPVFCRIRDRCSGKDQQRWDQQEVKSHREHATETTDRVHETFGDEQSGKTFAQGLGFAATKVHRIDANIQPALDVQQLVRGEESGKFLLKPFPLRVILTITSPLNRDYLCPNLLFEFTHGLGRRQLLPLTCSLSSEKLIDLGLISLQQHQSTAPAYLHERPKPETNDERPGNSPSKSVVDPSKCRYHLIKCQMTLLYGLDVHAAGLVDGKLRETDNTDRDKRPEA